MKVKIESCRSVGFKKESGRILTKLGTYLVLRRVWNLIDFQGHRSKVKVTGSNF
jgi:hypothetical protein